LPRLRGARVLRLCDLLRHAPRTEPTPATPDDLAVLQYTGGTTGVSKGAMLTHRNLVANAVQVWHWHPIHNPQGKAAALCVTPFFHVYGLTVGMNCSIYGGMTMLLLPRFIVGDVVRVIRKYRPVTFPGVPTMYLALATYPGIKPTDCAGLEACISGSAPLPAEVQDSFERATGGRVVEGYGLTEASPVTHTNPLGRPRLGTIGVPYPDTEAAIVDEAGRRLGPGEAGELVVRGPQVMQGYWHRPEETAQVLKDGWLHTGDIGTMNEEGYFAILDRAKDVIIASGFNVYPREVEEVLFTHPAVREAAVHGVPDPYRGETVKAVIVLKDGAHATEEEIIAYCRARLATFKAPHLVEFREALPKSAVGKVLRRELAREALERPSQAAS
jgi:long-chain acyl-CoA synthetase